MAALWGGSVREWVGGWGRLAWMVNGWLGGWRSVGGLLGRWLAWWVVGGRATPDAAGLERGANSNGE